MSNLLREMVHQDIDSWTEDKLERLKGVDLMVLCSLIGIPFTGNKRRLIERITTLAPLQFRLRRYDRNWQQNIDDNSIRRLAESMSANELKELCRTAGIYASSTKYGRAAGLLKWRRGCLRSGTAYLKSVTESKYSKKKQLWLF